LLYNGKERIAKHHTGKTESSARFLFFPIAADKHQTDRKKRQKTDCHKLFQYISLQFPILSFIYKRDSVKEKLDKELGIPIPANTGKVKKEKDLKVNHVKFDCFLHEKLIFSLPTA
jgi:hypothetical protein